jgi:excisionase family DNA binding protein
MVADETRLLVRIPEAADRLGLSRSTVYEMITAGELKVVRYGRAVRVPVSELAGWVERNVVAGEAPAVV